MAVGVWLLTGRPIRYGAPVSATAVPEASPSPTYAVARVTITTQSGRRLVCAWRTATQPARRPARALLVAGGEVSGRRAALLVDPAFEGVVMACDYPWRGLLDASMPVLLIRLPRLRAELLATPDLLAAAATYLLKRPEAAGAHLVVVGASLGVPAVSAWAASDPRPRAVALLYGGGDLRRPLDVLLAREAPSLPLRWLAAGLLARLLAPLEPARSVGAIAPRPLLVVGAADDERVPLASVAALVAAAREPKRVVWLRGAHLHPSDTGLLSALADTTLAWLKLVMPDSAPSAVRATPRAGAGWRDCSPSPGRGARWRPPGAWPPGRSFSAFAPA